MLETAYAQSNSGQASQDLINGIQKASGVVDTFTSTLGTSIVALLIAVALAVFLIGGIRYMFVNMKGSSSGAGDRKDVKWFLLNALLILTVMVSVWGIVTFVSNLVLGSDSKTTTIKPAQVQFQPSSGGLGQPSTSPGPGSSPLGGGSPLPIGVPPSSAGAGRGGTGYADGAACLSSVQCSSGSCISGRCVSLKSDGSTCTAGPECSSGFCYFAGINVNNGTCRPQGGSGIR